ncbi:GvpL/GvpF family gas vesicle protein [Streptomyces sp. NPDC058045]|uniref:GvpL/GvpF family gas vesicle protein n=1 Tax=Streptomyces sp. NPDC058045 TaxID=3346311 RepID=UPI0036E02C0B
MTASGIYVYGIVRGDHALPAGASGVGDPPAPVRLLPAGELAVVVSAAAPGLRARRRDLLAHQDLLLALAATGPVLPMRFGMVAPDETSASAGVTARGAEYGALLSRLDARVEVNIKATPVQDGLAALVREDPVVRRLREETRGQPSYENSIRLGEAVAAGLHRRAAAAASELTAELAPLAEELRQGPEVDGCVLNASFLVPREAEAQLRGVAEQFGAAHADRVELRVTGPLPCYSFVDATPVPAGV